MQPTDDLTDTAAFIEDCRRIAGDAQVLTDPSDLAAYGTDWTGQFSAPPLAVARPRTATEVSALVRLCAERGIAVVPQGGCTGLCGGGVPLAGQPSLVISTKRMNSIRSLDPAARTMVAEAGVVLETAQNAAREQGLVFPLTFGAQGSCMIGGALSTNAGGSNVVRYGTTRELCLGIEAVLPDGSVINALTGLRKDNTGYDLKDLLIGAEGTLGIITAAVFRLSPRPLVRTTGFLSVSSLAATPEVLNRLQDRTGGGVEAFEYMPRPAVDLICRIFPQIRQPLDNPAETGLFVEIASSRRDDAAAGDDGTARLQAQVLDVLGELMEEGIVLDAMIAQSDQQRADLWHMRESVLEAITRAGPAYHTDISLPLASVAQFVAAMDPVMAQLGIQPLTVGHLGDGNLHYTLTAAPGQDFAALPLDRAKQAIFAELKALDGSFSAEHGIGQSKLDVMRALKQGTQLAAMRAIKRALDPCNIMNPGKLVPPDPEPLA
ncbi:FAD-binding oxidoreductase [Paracoccus sp. (in: a-proteobacteria)]|uniref:FAD-binding oxidoreductase n=1 Tax=Paracoccus sp. TaxID=267 RepID=UPI003A8C1B3B